MRHVRRAGTYLRITDPTWPDPLDGTYSMRRGGRWNQPGSHPTLYLNRNDVTARANARQLLDAHLRGMPFAVDDLAPDELPMLVGVVVPDAAYVDVVTDAGCRAVGLPATYPLDTTGEVVAWAVCQIIGAEAQGAGEPGIACRSAAEPSTPGLEELAYFGNDASPAPDPPRPFSEWYGPIDW